MVHTVVQDYAERLLAVVYRLPAEHVKKEQTARHTGTIRQPINGCLIGWGHESIRPRAVEILDPCECPG
jgi:hypothetical protein